ncbi:MAG: UvrD-helicase domain-containing protein [Candidatus Pacebacteria bacterium]|jgi:DNA helicase-2/ATP-dependent DNA helicase PcrA|nr:UvrD-helicase domain-containing protein [Candidatus Paceibacterota bacterium]
MNKKDELNVAQKEAVLHTEGPLLIVAGAGAGKTKTLTARIASLIASGTPGESILAVTFTNKAAKEMRERVAALISADQSGSMPFVGTFHSLGVRLIRDNSEKLGVTRHFTILDEEDARSIIKDSLISRGLDPKQFEPRKIKAIISRNKSDFVTREQFAEKTSSYIEEVTHAVWEEYEARKKRENSLDFDDLLLLPTLLLKSDAFVREQYQRLWRHVHVDEYQDTNKVQYTLVTLLAEKHKNICVVGDSDQNIYSWRGANIENILRFERDYPGAKVVLLEENYRSTKTIIEAANEVIKKNAVRIPKNLFTNNKEGEKISLFEAWNEEDEARFVARTADRLIQEGAQPNNITVLYRANFQSRVLEEAFLMANVPYQVLGTKFFDRKEIKDVISYIKAALNRESLADVKRIINTPARGIGKTTIAKLFANQFGELPATMQKKINGFYAVLAEIKEAVETTKPSEAIKFLIKKTGIEEVLATGSEEDKERLENIKELVTLATRYDPLEGMEGVEKLLEDAALASEQDSLEEKKEKIGVKLMTVHTSKGLEFPHVFVVGLEQGLFPHDRMDTQKTKDEDEEERRLFYVALTRAREKVYLSWANMRTIFGMKQVNTPSEFLYDIPEQLIERKEREHENEFGGKVIYLD